MTVSYTPPAEQTVLMGNASSVNLGSFTATDTGPWTVTVDWNDLSQFSTFQVSSTGVIPAQSHTFPYTGTFGPRVTVTSTVSPFLSSNNWFYCASLSSPAVTPTSAPVMLPFSGDFTEKANTNPPVNYLYEVPFGKIYAAANTRWVASYSWGDGNTNFYFPGVTEAWVIPRTNTGLQVESLHAYANPGTYTATVTLTNVDNPALSGSMSRTVVVS